MTRGVVLLSTHMPQCWAPGRLANRHSDVVSPVSRSSKVSVCYATFFPMIQLLFVEGWRDPSRRAFGTPLRMTGGGVFLRRRSLSHFVILSTHMPRCATPGRWTNSNSGMVSVAARSFALSAGYATCFHVIQLLLVERRRSRRRIWAGERPQEKGNRGGRRERREKSGTEA